MNDLRKAAEMALSALEGCYPSQADQFLAQADASNALRNALDAEKPAEVEPVAKVNRQGFIVEIDDIQMAEGTLLYMHPSDAAAQIASLKAQFDQAADYYANAKEQIAELEKRESELNGDLKQCQNYCGQYVEQIAKLEAKLAIAVNGLNHYAARSGSRVARMALEEIETMKH